MEEVEGLTESSEEHIHHAAHSGPKWASWVALSTAILSTLAAVASLESSSNSDEAMINQILASDQWNYYEAKGIKSAIAETRSDLLVAAGKPVDDALKQKLDRYKEEQEQIKEKATDFEKERTANLARHEFFSKSVTLFQVAISISAISILTKRRRYFGVSLFFGACGLFFLLAGLLRSF